MSEQAEGRWGEQGGPLQRRASRPPAEVCGSLPPAPPASPGRAEPEKRLERRAVVQEPRCRATGSRHAVSSGATEPEARAGRAEVPSTGQHAHPQRAAPGGLRPAGVREGPAGVRGQRQEEDEEQPRRAAWKWQQRANGPRPQLPEQSSGDAGWGTEEGALASAPSRGSG